MAEKTDLTLDISQPLAALAEYDKRLEVVERGYAALSQATRTHGATAKTALVQGAEAAKAEAAAIDRLQTEYKQTADAVQTLRRALAGAYDPRAIASYTKAVAGGEQAMRKMERAAGSLGVNLKAANKEASTGQQAFEGMFGALTKATIIVSVLNQVRKLGSEAIGLADNYGKAQKSFAAFLGSAEKADVVLADLNKTAQANFLPVANVQAAGKALLAFGENASNLPSVLTRVANIAAATGKDFNELALIYGKARTQGVLFAEDINQLTDAGIPIIQQFAKQLGVSTGEVKKLASEGKIGFAELELAFAQLTAEGQAFAGQASAAATASAKLDVATQSLLTTLGQKLKPAADAVKTAFADILIALDDLTKSNSLQSFVQNSIELMGQLNPFFDAFRTRLERLIGVNTRKNSSIVDDDEKALNARRQQEFEERQLLINAEAERKKLAAGSAKERAAEAEKRRKQREQEAKALEDHNRRLLELSLERLDPGSEARAIAQENLRFSALMAEFKKFGLETEEIEAQHVFNLFNIRADFYQKRLDQQRKAEAEELADLENFLADRRDTFEQERTINDDTINLAEERSKAFILRLKAQGASQAEIQAAQAEFDLFLQQARLRNELEFQEKLLLITDGGNVEQVEAVKRRIELIKAQLENVNFQIDNPAAGKKTFNIWRAFGIDPDTDEGKLAIESLRDSADQFGQIISGMTAAWVAAADARVAARDRDVQSAEDTLDRQIQLAELGFAADVGAAQKALEEAKKNKEKALQEQRRAQRAQIALDATAQVSNIALSATNLVKTWSTLPFGVGLLAAAAQIAGLVALIASVRSRARALSAPQFRHGGEARVENGVLVGPSHEAGGIGINAEGGEFATSDGKRLSIVNKKATAKHFDLLQAINADDRRAIFKYSLALSGSNMPEIDRKGIARRMQSGADTTTATDSRQLDRLIEIQQRMLAHMIGGKGETWSPDGKTRRRGIVTTRFN